MKLKSFNFFIGLLIISFYSPLLGDEEIDIWKNKKEITSESPQINQINEKSPQNTTILQSSEPVKTLEKIKNLPEHTIILPGHDYGSTPISTIGREKKNNPYLNKSEKYFLRFKYISDIQLSPLVFSFDCGKLLAVKCNLAKY